VIMVDQEDKLNFAYLVMGALIALVVISTVEEPRIVTVDRVVQGDTVYIPQLATGVANKSGDVYSKATLTLMGNGTGYAYLPVTGGGFIEKIVVNRINWTSGGVDLNFTDDTTDEPILQLANFAGAANTNVVYYPRRILDDNTGSSTSSVDEFFVGQRVKLHVEGGGNTTTGIASVYYSRW